jgi:hypothetical protein
VSVRLRARETALPVCEKKVKTHTEGPLEEEVAFCMGLFLRFLAERDKILENRIFLHV